MAVHRIAPARRWASRQRKVHIMSPKRLALASTALGLTIAALAAAPVATAEPRDQFLAELATLNIVLPSANQADTVGAGYHTCEQLRNGASVLDEMAVVEQMYHLAHGQGTLFVSAATTNLCPDFAG
jgi:hypothetical protein